MGGKETLSRGMQEYILDTTLLEIKRNKEGLCTVRNKACLNSFIKLSLRFWSLYHYLNHFYSGRNGDYLYKDRKFEFIPKLYLIKV